ncbi:MAG: hypothetical protein UR69_C0001G0241 [Candidatus Moranbacteria bacterium GW2011_GWE2_35_2-]|nr:MAG: hypothetical protein UR69_C0001G0241 [Candidatus Moranbacteria bacterium GW2011_GWE2_35_2-]KKQ04198.1 MAG: hypothetical protein US15_C0065G0002 [Candidatus Moranbacteria bacterium GW2011_GWF1_36_4]KKQ22761.1 MAG: hypothetical protein US37_C0001G0033 [Candidatus Moranbacteria bacterium GW2011_GWF2_37_11]KKQ28915.1 MAG: hypothetical protein US44_C0005G0057 [Candidatus Moranbacteria bacterium GW2011_GWD1_37_17]KKQ31008.1 MAG: hypothetical protein US47_C0001G0241 [Candidatus Moranbacteria b
MKKSIIIVVFSVVAVFSFFGQSMAATTIGFDGSEELPLTTDGYWVFSPLDAPEDVIMEEGYLHVGCWVGIERLDGGAFTLKSFTSMSPDGEIEVWADTKRGVFSVGTNSFQPAVPPPGWDMEESMFFLSFWATGDIDNVELASKTLIPKPLPTPVPSAFWLLSAGLGGIAACRRRRKK